MQRATANPSFHSARMTAGADSDEDSESDRGRGAPKPKAPPPVRRAMGRPREFFGLAPVVNVVAGELSEANVLSGKRDRKPSAKGRPVGADGGSISEGSQHPRDSASRFSELADSTGGSSREPGHASRRSSKSFGWTWTTCLREMMMLNRFSPAN